MIIQGYPDELNYVNATLHPEAPKCGSFMEKFCQACLAADSDNYELIRGALAVFMKKYPPKPERLAMEREDTGT